MASNEQNVTYLLKIKKAQVKALQDIGFSDIDEDSRASSFAERIKWAAGLLDIRVAADRKKDGKKFFFTAEDWKTIDDAGKSEDFVRRGIRIRACGRSFVMALQYYKNKAWGSLAGVDNLTSYNGSAGLWDPIDVKKSTDAILSFYSGKNADGVVGAPASETARSYRAYVDSDGVRVNGVNVDDSTAWSLPDVNIAIILYRYRLQIDDFISSTYGSSFLMSTNVDFFWTCCQTDTSSVWCVSLLCGVVANYQKTNTYSVIPVSEE